MVALLGWAGGSAELDAVRSRRFSAATLCDGVEELANQLMATNTGLNKEMCDSISRHLVIEWPLADPAAKDRAANHDGWWSPQRILHHLARAATRSASATTGIHGRCMMPVKCPSLMVSACILDGVLRAMVNVHDHIDGWKETETSYLERRYKLYHDGGIYVSVFTRCLYSEWCAWWPRLMICWGAIDWPHYAAVNLPTEIYEHSQIGTYDLALIAASPLCPHPGHSTFPYPSHSERTLEQDMTIANDWRWRVQQTVWVEAVSERGPSAHVLRHVARFAMVVHGLLNADDSRACNFDDSLSAAGLMLRNIRAEAIANGCLRAANIDNVNPLRCALLALSIGGGQRSQALFSFYEHLFGQLDESATRSSATAMFLGMVGSVANDGDGICDLTDPLPHHGLSTAWPSGVILLGAFASLCRKRQPKDRDGALLQKHYETLRDVTAARMVAIRDFRSSFPRILTRYPFLPAAELLPIIAAYAIHDLHNPAVLDHVWSYLPPSAPYFLPIWQPLVCY